MPASICCYGSGVCYGDGTIYAGFGTDQPSGTATQPLRRGATVRIYDRNDQLTRVISSNAGTSILQKCSFELLDTGPGKIDLTVTERIDIEADYRIDCHLWNDPSPIYSGFAQGKPVPGTTERSWAITGFGFFAMAEDSLVTARFPAGTYPHQMAAALAEILRADTGGRISMGAISPTTQATQAYQVDSNGVVLVGLPVAAVTYQIAGNVQWVRTPFKDAMQVVCDLSGQFRWGVDASRQFFFQPVTSAVSDDCRWWAGRHLATYVPVEDSSQIKNRAFVKLGQVRRDLPPSDPLWATNFLELPLDNLPSQALYRVRSKVYSAAATLSPTDATRAAAVDLARVCVPIQKASVTGIDFDGRKITAAGSARITGRDGLPLTLPKTKVVYTIQGSSIKVDVQLGPPDRTPGSLLNTITKAQAEANLIQQNTQNHASTV